MCVGKTCGGGADHCCSNDCFDSDGPRACGMFIMLHMDIFLLINLDKLISIFFSMYVLFVRW